MVNTKKYYFASDLHLGLPNFEESLKREKLFVKWLDEIKHDAQAIFLLGDIFDFWWEWKRVIPKGFTRFLGKLSELSDSGIEIHYFVGNHDIWVFNYLEKETGVRIHRSNLTITLFDKKFYLTHGDGLGPGDYSYKILKKIFHNSFLQWCYSRLHPNFGMWIGQSWSQDRRSVIKKYEFKGEENEWLIVHSKQVLLKENFDYFVYGHRHIPMILKISDSANYVNLGDWLYNFTFGVFDGNSFDLKSYKTHYTNTTTT